MGWEDPLEKGKATHSSILAWRLPQTYSPWGCKESDMTEQLSFTSLHFKFYLAIISETSDEKATCVDPMVDRDLCSMVCCEFISVCTGEKTSQCLFPFQTVLISTLQENCRKEYGSQDSDIPSHSWLVTHLKPYTHAQKCYMFRVSVKTQGNKHIPMVLEWYTIGILTIHYHV